jgi:ketosteroid isomerase-like protein
MHPAGWRTLFTEPALSVSRRKEHKMKARLAVLSILLLVAITSGCGSPQTDHMAIRDAYEEALEAGDLDAAMALFADDAVVLTTIGTFEGKGEVRQLVEMDRAFLQRNPFGERVNVEETEDTLNYDEKLTSADGTTTQLHHTYVFEDGKIKEWTMSDIQTVE